VSLSLDGELSELEQVSLRAHVGRCAECAGFERDLGVLTRELRATTLERSAVMLPRRRSAAVRVLQISAVAASVVLAAGLGSLAGSLGSPGTTTATTARTGGSNPGAVLERGLVALAPGQKLPASRIRPSVAL